jgi:methionine synthase II (cobalamin-independent)
MAVRVTLDGAMKGAKFPTKEEAIEAMWEFFKDQMSREEFEKFIQSHIEEV